MKNSPRLRKLARKIMDVIESNIYILVNESKNIHGTVGNNCRMK